MKSCPECKRTFADSFSFCLVDGSILSAPFDSELTQAAPTVRVDPAPTEVMPLPAPPTAEPVMPTLASPSPTIYRPQYAPTPDIWSRRPLIARLTRGMFAKLVFGAATGYIIAAIVVIARLGFWKRAIVLSYPLGAVIGLLIGVIIAAVCRSNGYKRGTIVTGTIVGAIVGVAVRFILFGVFTRVLSGQISALMYALGADFYGTGGWLGSLLFGAGLGTIIGAVYRLSANR
ncbi:MAG: hypothetical protein QOJ64_4154 [Acidobacteriota bacterium]|jgi:hypothetical protein|nr:hypothetical protein [Acidobacteriota bacterium]